MKKYVKKKSVLCRNKILESSETSRGHKNQIRAKKSCFARRDHFKREKNSIFAQRVFQAENKDSKTKKKEPFSAKKMIPETRNKLARETHDVRVPGANQVVKKHGFSSHE